MSDRYLKFLLDHLPAIYREDPWLEQFLRPFSDVFSGFEQLLAGIDRFCIPLNPVDPAYQADPEFLPWLAGWLALELDEEWDEQKRREVISRAVELYRLRGTVKGLKEYLKIYTGHSPEIQECAWPSGMQIGVASMIGGFDPPAGFASFAAERQGLAKSDWYLVTEFATNTEYLYAADLVERVDADIDLGRVTIFHKQPGDYSFTQTLHESATVTRRDGLADTIYDLTGIPYGGTETEAGVYCGDTVLIEDEREIPYRFIVDLTVPSAVLEQVRVEKIKGIIDLEKPAHTLYYLRLNTEENRGVLSPMQIAIRSTIGIETILG
ncbi:phage tail protein [Geobacter sp. OR-1]|uniref:phage tail protein n=1 Tax=Geobacter sp. OR-1 TaxID=1266765 RepID=UPI00054387A1|nr:phage tail protein [Geobacter sp. OR-1]GAM10171.1 phage tail protein [Geobacter sp. OR-1]